MSISTDQGRKRMLSAILSRSASDPAFRAGLLREPKQAISQAFGVTIPEQFKVQFIEKDSTLDALVVLPDLRLNGAELSESELEVVNGGGDLLFAPEETPW
jgi:hypothetical protein